MRRALGARDAVVVVLDTMAGHQRAGDPPLPNPDKSGLPSKRLHHAMRTCTRSMKLFQSPLPSRRLTNLPVSKGSNSCMCSPAQAPRIVCECYTVSNLHRLTRTQLCNRAAGSRLRRHQTGEAQWSGAAPAFARPGAKIWAQYTCKQQDRHGSSRQVVAEAVSRRTGADEADGGLGGGDGGQRAAALGVPIHLRHDDLPHLRFAAVRSCRNKADSVFQLRRPSEAIRTVQQLY